MNIEYIAYKIERKKFGYLTLKFVGVSLSDIETIETIMDRYLLFGRVKKERKITGRLDEAQGLINYTGQPYVLFGKNEHGYIKLDCIGVVNRIEVQVTSSGKKAVSVLKEIKERLNPELSDAVRDTYQKFRILVGEP